MRRFCAVPLSLVLLLAGCSLYQAHLNQRLPQQPDHHGQGGKVSNAQLREEWEAKKQAEDDERRAKCEEHFAAEAEALMARSRWLAENRASDADRAAAAREQGVLRKDDYCYVLVERRNEIVPVQVDCGQPAPDDRDVVDLAGPEVPMVPMSCAQYR